MNQKELVINFIIKMGGTVSSNHLRDFAHSCPMADATRRARELIAEGKLTRRWITKEEKIEKNYKVDVMVYEIPRTGGQLKLVM